MEAPTRRAHAVRAICSSIAEVALTLVLLSAAGLVLKSFANARALGLGFDPRLLLSARIDLPEPSYSDGKKVLNFSAALMEKLSALPGVEQVALSSNPPLMTGWQTSFLPEGATEPEPGKVPADGDGRRDAGLFSNYEDAGAARPGFRGHGHEGRASGDDNRSVARGPLFPRAGCSRQTHSDVHRRKR